MACGVKGGCGRSMSMRVRGTWITARAADRTARALRSPAGARCACLLRAAALVGVASAAAGPGRPRLLYAPGKIVPIPASIPHEAGDMVDRRILPDLRWIARRYPIFVTDGYSGPLPDGGHAGCDECHTKGSDHYNGLAVDLVPAGRGRNATRTWAPITRLALWAEPVQNEPVPPFRWVGYEGDAGHGCGNHLHLSWNHAPAPRFQLAEWVEVFPVAAGSGPRNAAAQKRGAEAPEAGGSTRPHRRHRRPLRTAGSRTRAYTRLTALRSARMRAMRARRPCDRPLLPSRGALAAAAAASKDDSTPVACLRRGGVYLARPRARPGR